MNTLDQLEADYKERRRFYLGLRHDGSGHCVSPSDAAIFCDQVVTLIDLIRKKDEALEQIAHDSHDPNLTRELDEIINLTDKLQ